MNNSNQSQQTTDPQLIEFLISRGIIRPGKTDLELKFSVDKVVSLTELMTSWASIKIFDVSNFKNRAFWFNYSIEQEGNLFMDDMLVLGIHPIEVVSQMNLKAREDGKTIKYQLQNYGDLTFDEYIRFKSIYDAFQQEPGNPEVIIEDEDNTIKKKSKKSIKNGK